MSGRFFLHRNSMRVPARIRYCRGMERRQLPAILLVLTGMISACLASGPTVQSATNDGWKLGSESGGVALSSRLRPGSSLKEFKAVGAIDAPTRAVHCVIDDFENYPSFMPYMAECRLVKTENDSILTYQRLPTTVGYDADHFDPPQHRPRGPERTGQHERFTHGHPPPV